jgi:hypothetical protein
VRWIVAALGLVTAACRAGPGPVLESIDPWIVFQDRSTPVAIRGIFQAPVSANLDRPGVSDLKPYELELSTGGRVVTSMSAEFRERRTLWAVLPAGMPQGTYRARVVDPWGKEAALESALVVVAARAGRDQPLVDPGYLDPSVRVPPLPEIYATPTVGDVNTLFYFDAYDSRDTKTPVALLEVSWGFELLDGGVQWTDWTINKEHVSHFLAGQDAVLLRARDEDGDVGYAARRIFVAADPTDLCEVTTWEAVDDGAQDCSNSLGPDGLLSLDEALRLAPVLKPKVVGFKIPATAALTGSPLTITDAIRLAGTPNITLERELIIASTGKVRISNLVVKGPAGKLRIENGAKLDLSDSEFSGAEPIRAIGGLAARRTSFRDCMSQCIVLTGGDGNVQVSQSSFTAGPSSAIAIDLHQCSSGLGPVAELVGNVFVGFVLAVNVGANCQRATSIVHQTFYRNTVGIDFSSGTQHVLQNNVFTRGAEPIVGCGLFNGFESRQNNVVYDNTWDECLATDPGAVGTDPPLFASPSDGDFRLQWGSLLIDAAPPIVVDGGTLDVNGAATGAYLGARPDYGGRETY